MDNADRTVENMIAAVENVQAQIESLIKTASARGYTASATDALKLVDTIAATYATLLPQ